MQRMRRDKSGAALGVALVMAASVLPGVCRAADPAWLVPGGDPRRAPKLIHDLGCAACHTVPGVEGALGNVGPPLTRIGERTYIAGVLRNTPANMVRWIREPQAVLPGNAMPNMGVSEAQARDIAAYLYTLR